MDTGSAELVGSVELGWSGAIDYDARRRHFAHCGVLDRTANETQTHAGLHGVSMSDYPNTQPFGPHGPQVPANSVMPNPTAQGSQSMIGGGSDYAAPRGAYASGGGRYVLGPKSMVKAIILSILVAPFGVVYATFGTRQFRWAVLWLGGSVLLMFAIGLPLAPIIGVSVVWSVLAVRANNRQFGNR
jgi:hypothetical protein